jgi:hypothetical protein
MHCRKKLSFWFSLSAAAVFFVCPVVHAAGAPRELLNKTITENWIIQQTWRDAGGMTRSAGTPRTRTIYISSQGRPFVRDVRDKGTNSISNLAPNEKMNPVGGVSSTKFEGRQLVTIDGQIHGANRTLVNFDASFSTCTMTWSAGSSGGSMRWQFPNGQIVDVLSASGSGYSCSIREGNAFAN